MTTDTRFKELLATPLDKNANDRHNSGTITRTVHLKYNCYMSVNSKSPDAFVRFVTGAPFPMVMLAFDWTLDNLVRFCTPSTSFSILGINPTFSLGDFDLTVTTYRHMLLTSKDDVRKHPTLIGPLFVHVKKLLKHIISLCLPWLAENQN